MIHKWIEQGNGYNEDHPLVKARMDALMFGTGFVLVRNNGDVEYIPPERYMELSKALIWVDEQIKNNPLHKSDR